VLIRFLLLSQPLPESRKTSMMYFSRSIQTRRQFLLRSSALSLSALVPPRLIAQLTQSANPPEDDPQLSTIPRDTLLKFNSDGTARPFAGNTVICHLPQQTRFRDAVVAFGDALHASSFSTKLAVLPGDSYHVTILGGPNDQDRRRYGWPSDIPISTPIAECNRVIGERIARFKMHAELPIRFCLDKEKTVAPQRPSGLQLVPADANERLKIRTLRDHPRALFDHSVVDRPKFLISGIVCSNEVHAALLFPPRGG